METFHWRSHSRPGEKIIDELELGAIDERFPIECICKDCEYANGPPFVGRTFQTF